MEEKKVSYVLLEEDGLVENFLKSQFNQSASRLKKYFNKSQLNKSTYKKMILDLPLNFVNDGMINPVYQGESISIISECDLFFVFNKNPNQFIHPLSYDESNNCLSYLRSESRFDLLQVNEEHYDRGLLYRLDFETSGVVVFVKNNNDYKFLRENFGQVAHEKKYLCWVHGKLTKEGNLVHSFSSSESKGRLVRVSALGDFDQVGELSFRPLEYNVDLDISLVEVKLISGLRHQIRAQMSHIGYPLVGDELYGGKKAKRLYLHALEYTIFHQGRAHSWRSAPSNFNGL